MWCGRTLQDRIFTEASSDGCSACHSVLATVLRTWREQCKVRAEKDWVFASRLHNGRRPYWGAAILRKSIRSVTEKLGIDKRIGWHTFRHTYCTLLRSLGVQFKVMQELMRHSSLCSTLDVYTQAVGPAKRPAQAAVFSLFFPSTIPKTIARSSEPHSYLV